MTAKTINLTREGYGVVEPNFLSAPRSGQVFASLPAADGIDILENGMFVKYGWNADDACEEVSFNGEGPWFLVFNEEKLYDERYQMHKDYAMKRDQFYDGIMVPRVLAMLIGDRFTTNMFADSVTEVTEGDIFAPNDEGKLAADEDGFLQAVKCYTMPDGQPGVKLQVIANQ